MKITHDIKGKRLYPVIIMEAVVLIMGAHVLSIRKNAKRIVGVVSNALSSFQAVCVKMENVTETNAFVLEITENVTRISV